jgi:hypothetical protein
MPDDDSEIDRIKHELDILQTRRSLYVKWGRVTTIFCAAAAVVAVAVVVAGIIEQGIDPISIAVFVVVAAAVAGILWLSGNLLPQVAPNFRPDLQNRVNIVRFKVRPAGLVPLYKSYVHPYSMLDEINEMIASRERRLAELRETENGRS